MTDVRAYIAFRYPNWMDYARYQCRVQHLDEWAADLMNEIIVDLLRKPESKLTDLMSRQTRKIVNGEPTTELDKFVLNSAKSSRSATIICVLMMVTFVTFRIICLIFKLNYPGF